MLKYLGFEKVNDKNIIDKVNNSLQNTMQRDITQVYIMENQKNIGITEFDIGFNNMQEIVRQQSRLIINSMIFKNQNDLNLNKPLFLQFFTIINEYKPLIEFLDFLEFKQPEVLYFKLIAYHKERDFQNFNIILNKMLSQFNQDDESIIHTYIQKWDPFIQVENIDMYANESNIQLFLNQVAQITAQNVNLSQAIIQTQLNFRINNPQIKVSLLKKVFEYQLNEKNYEEAYIILQEIIKVNGCQNQLIKEFVVQICTNHQYKRIFNNINDSLIFKQVFIQNLKLQITFIIANLSSLIFDKIRTKIVVIQTHNNQVILNNLINQQIESKLKEESINQMEEFVNKLDTVQQELQIQAFKKFKPLYYEVLNCFYTENQMYFSASTCLFNYFLQLLKIFQETQLNFKAAFELLKLAQHILVRSLSVLRKAHELKEQSIGHFEEYQNQDQNYLNNLIQDITNKKQNFDNILNIHLLEKCLHFINGLIKVGKKLPKSQLQEITQCSRLVKNLFLINEIEHAIQLAQIWELNMGDSLIYLSERLIETQDNKDDQLENSNKFVFYIENIIQTQKNSLTKEQYLKDVFDTLLHDNRMTPCQNLIDIYMQTNINQLLQNFHRNQRLDVIFQTNINFVIFIQLQIECLYKYLLLLKKSLNEKSIQPKMSIKNTEYLTNYQNLYISPEIIMQILKPNQFLQSKHQDLIESIKNLI